MNKRNLLSKLSLLCAGLLLFDAVTSAQVNGERKIIFTGSIDVTGTLPEELTNTEINSVSFDRAFRSALPSFTIGSNYFYYVDATQTDGNSSVSIDSISNPH